MRLKEIIGIHAEREELEEFEAELQSGKWYMDEDLLYRGEDFDAGGTWKIKSIRNNRRPRDSVLYLQAIIDGIGSNLKTDYPLRRESKFAGGLRRKDEMKNYGYLKVCFPEKSASIFHRQTDPYHLFEELSTKAKRIDVSFRNDLDRDQYPYLYDFYKLLESPSENSRNIFLLLSKRYKKIYKSCNDIVSKNITKRFKWTIKSTLKLFTRIRKDYFDKLNKGVNKDAYEHIFDGDKYLMIQEKIFERYFKYDGNIWKLKKESEVI